MGAKLRAALSRWSPLFWLAAASSVAVYFADERLRALVGLIILTGLAGFAGTVSGAISATDGHDKALLLDALLANQPPRAAEAEIPQRDLHAA